MRQPRFVKISSKKSVCFVLFMVVKHKAEFIMERSCQMKETNGKKLFRGEAALALAVLINSFGVVLMLYSGALILSLMIMRKKFVTSYLFSFAVGFVFSELLDVHELWINVLPSSLAWRIVYFIISYVLICIGIALSNRCQLPIVPTDLFPRELADIAKITYPKIKIGFDVTCLAVTAGLTFFCLGRIDGLGIGTILGIAGDIIDKQSYFKSFMSKKQQA
jgi:uncharacterized membrane protein YczE